MQKAFGLPRFSPNTQLLKIVAVVLFTAFISLESLGQPILDPNKKISQYVLQSWNTEHGMTSESTNDLLQSQDGYIWIGTYTGLHRFDGQNFKIFNAENSTIPSTNVLRMGLDSHDDIWVGTLHGIARFKNGEFDTPEPLKPYRNYSIESMLITQKDEIWFASKSNNLFLYKNDSVHNYSDLFFNQKSTILTIVENSQGDILMGTDDSRLIQFEANGELRDIPIPSNVNGINVIYAQNNRLYLGTGVGLYIYENDILSRVEEFNNTVVITIAEDSRGNLWIGTMQGLFRLKKGEHSVELLDESNGLTNNIIRDIIISDDGSIWGGTYRSGIFMLSDGAITTYSKNDGLATDVIVSITQIDSSSFLLGNENGELNLVQDGKIKQFVIDKPLPKARLKHLFTDNQGVIWASTYGGLVRIKNEKSHKFSTENGFPDNFIRVTFQDSKGNIWVGTKNSGLIKFIGEDQYKVIGAASGLTSNYVMAIHENDKNQLIVSTISGISIIEDDEVIKTITVEDGLPSNFTFTTFSDGDVIWIASNDGLIRYDNGNVKVYDVNNGMPSNIVYDILPDRQNNFWMPSDQSIIKVSRDRLNLIVDSSSLKMKAQQFNRSHGLKNNHCLGGVLSIIDSSGDFWIPTLGGAAFINTGNVTYEEVSANTIVESIVFNNMTHMITDNSFIVPASIDRVYIEYTGINYKNTSNLVFRYRLSPFEKDWVYAGNQRRAAYTNIPPGDYRFEVQTGMEDFFSGNTDFISISFDASWYQTFWAKTSFLIISISFGLGLYVWRVRSLRGINARLESVVNKRTEELISQKEELSMALKELSEAQDQIIQSEKMASLGVLSAGIAHEINNPLNYIQGGITMLEGLDFHNHKDHEQIDELIVLIKQGVKRAGNIVSSLNEFSHHRNIAKEPCSPNHFIKNCLSILKNQIRDGITVFENFSNEDYQIKGNNGQLHQVFLNILTNAIQSIEKQGYLTIHTFKDNHHMVIEITDTGQGIDPKILSKITEPFFTTKAPGKGTGLGLSIAYNIVKDHNGTIEFKSEVDKGTKVIVKFPII
ncbi:MAG: signal transduction histidine kinase/ligand-binding sensor domain-containing protein [Marinoscillum sp.]